MNKEIEACLTAIEVEILKLMENLSTPDEFVKVSDLQVSFDKFKVKFNEVKETFKSTGKI